MPTSQSNSLSWIWYLLLLLFFKQWNPSEPLSFVFLTPIFHFPNITISFLTEANRLIFFCFQIGLWLILEPLTFHNLVGFFAHLYPSLNAGVGKLPWDLAYFLCQHNGLSSLRSSCHHPGFTLICSKFLTLGLFMTINARLKHVGVWNILNYGV